MKHLRQKLAQIESEYRSGLTLQQIGTKYGVTREYIRQILSAVGVSRKAGGHSVRARRNREKIADAKDRKCRNRYGISYTEYRALDTRVRRAFQEQLRTSRCRGIAFTLTLREWLDVWNTSGKWAERGRGHGYCMARIDDAGAYEMGNVYITTGAENAAEYQRAKNSGRKPPTRVYVGVYLAYPGLAKPFIARIGSKSLGGFTTAEEARAARTQHGATIPRHKGWCYRPNNKTNPYVALIQVGGRVRYLGSYPTPEAAHAVYAVAYADSFQDRRYA